MLYYSSIRELNWRFQQGILTPIELTETILQKANQVEVGILLDTFEAQALEEAKASTKRWQKQVALGLFDGIPCVWKDLFDVKGSVTTAGSKAYQNHPQALADAPIVTTYTKCGGINIGKAGRSRWMRKRPTVRGSVMNPNDHPHGGGEGKAPIGRKAPLSPWGKPALGYKSRNKRAQSDKLIVRRRNEK